MDVSRPTHTWCQLLVSCTHHIQHYNAIVIYQYTKKALKLQYIHVFYTRKPYESDSINYVTNALFNKTPIAI